MAEQTVGPDHFEAPFADGFHKTTIMGGERTGWALPKSPEKLRLILEKFHSVLGWSYHDDIESPEPSYKFELTTQFNEKLYTTQGVLTDGETPGFFFEDYTPRQVWQLTEAISLEFRDYHEFVICFDEFRCFEYRSGMSFDKSIEILGNDFDLKLSEAFYPLNFMGEE
jgi:hypothetical protein